jgi:hypothetical protein
MWTVFVEYRVRIGHWEKFIREIPRIREATRKIAPVRQHAFLRASDQPALVVETIASESLEAARRILMVRGSEEECPCGLDVLAEGTRKAWLFEVMDTGSESAGL